MDRGRRRGGRLRTFCAGGAVGRWGGASADDTLTLDFTSPATNSAEGAAWSDDIKYPTGTYNTFDVTVTRGDYIVPASNIATFAGADRVSISLSPDTVQEGTSIQPFTLEFLHDPDQGDDQFTLVIEFADAAQTNLGSFSPTNTLTGNESTLQSAIGNLVFAAAEGHITSTNPVVVPLRMTASDGFGGSGAETNLLTILPLLTPPSMMIRVAPMRVRCTCLNGIWTEPTTGVSACALSRPISPLPRALACR